MIITVPNPSSPLDVPIYEGEDSAAVGQLVDGVYDAVTDDELALPGQLVVHQGSSVFELDQCGMLGCPHPAPHNHPAWALA